MKISDYRYDGKAPFDISKVKTDSDAGFKNREEATKLFENNINEIREYQEKLYAERKEGIIFIFQAMDAAGKDGIIRTVFSILSPHGVKEFCFKAPSTEELAHDYLWRFWPALPAKGFVSLFNRSYYEDVLVGKVHKLYENQLKADRINNKEIIEKRYMDIANFEKYLYDNSISVVKLFLNISKDEQAQRFISRIDTPRKNWKVSVNDMKERQYWDDYQAAFETMVNKTATKYSPWYVIPADRKWAARTIVSQIVSESFKQLNPKWPQVDPAEAKSFAEERAKLISQLPYDKAAKIFESMAKENAEEESDEAEIANDKAKKSSKD